MPRVGRSRNPLRVLLVVVAIVFSLSAWLYYLATIRAPDADSAGAARLMTFFRDHGTAVLFVELFLLAIAAGGVVFRDGQGPRRGK